jgi:DNA repair protein RecN (Recombination protein N)
MLEELNIRNYALIESLTLSFRKGFSVFSGETGAGKSIIVGSLGFLLGSKTGVDVIRTGTGEASVSAVVSIDKSNGDALLWLAGKDIELEEGTVIVRRSIKAAGRSPVYIQNVPVTHGDLEEFMGLLFDLHGQHNHESLLRKESHRLYLDRFAGLEEETAAFNKVFMDLAEKRRVLEVSLTSEKDRETRLEILRYAVEEIEKASVKSGESRELESEARRLGDYEKLSLHVNSAAAALCDGEVSVLSLARRTKTGFDNAAAIDSGLAEMQKRMEDLYYEAEDLSGEFRSYRDRMSYDPQKLEEVEERLSLLYKLRKKYVRTPGAGPSPRGSPEEAEKTRTAEDAILAYKADAETEIEVLSNAAENRDKLKAEISALEKDLYARAAAISEKRKSEAFKLASGICEILKHLGMPHARFQAAVLPKGQGAGAMVCGPWGADEVEFMISANQGEPLKELSRIASGGELSRVMLAIKTVLSGADTLETLVFDEIDTGIGGEVALSVGEYLARIGAHKQIFCVTHLASIAVRADNHLKVEKRTDGGRTFTGVVELDQAGRRREIARMLAGDSGPAALAHADDLLAKYGKKVRSG